MPGNFLGSRDAAVNRIKLLVSWGYAWGWEILEIKSSVFHFSFSKIFIIVGCAESSLLHGLFSTCWAQGLFPTCSAPTFHCGGLL